MLQSLPIQLLEIKLVLKYKITLKSRVRLFLILSLNYKYFGNTKVISFASKNLKPFCNYKKRLILTRSPLSLVGRASDF